MLNVHRELLSSALLVLLCTGAALAQEPAPQPPGQAWRGLSAPPAPKPSDEPGPAASSPPGAAAPPVSAAPAAPAALGPPPPVVASPTTQDDAVRLSPPPPPQQGPRARVRREDPPVQPAASPADEREEEDERDPMAWLGLSVKLGVANVNSGNLKNPTYNAALATYAASVPPETLVGTGLVGTGACTPIDEKCRTPSRVGFQLALTLHVGGDGFGWDAEPFVTIGGEAVAAGVYTGPKFDIHVIDPLYLGFGFGAKAAYVALDQWAYGGDIFGRIPVHATYYLSEDFALTLEGSFGAGVSLFVSEAVAVTDPRNGRRLATTPKIAVGAARSWDLTLGLRFP